MKGRSSGAGATPGPVESAVLDTNTTRRAFCVRGCQSLATITLAQLSAGCGGTAPTAPTVAPPLGVTPTPPEPPGPPGQPGPPTPAPGPVVPLPTVSATLVDGVLTVAIDATSPLAAPGGAALTQAVAGGITRFFLLARLTADDFSALNAVCTHEGCTVSRFASPLFVCPCHGSRYNTQGDVVQGPAPAALPRFQAGFSNGVLSVRF